MRTATPEHVDVLVVGAGLSGIGAACHLQRSCPDRSYLILEARERVGGTWDLFRYPGVRSDSDMHTLGYSFSPWEDAKAIADGPSILRYVTETARRYGVLDRIRTGHAVTGAEYSTADARWTVHVQRADTGATEIFTCGFLFCCGGYYRYDAGYTPRFAGVERFPGPVIHPQHWPEDLEYAGKRVLVIGSGATAVTLVPAMAHAAAHVTMLQRSPTYVVSLPSRDAIADWLRRRLPRTVAYRIVRTKNVAMMTLSFQLSRRRPKLMKAIIRRGAERQLPAGCDVDAHFRPDYDPWDQRMCMVPDGDLFRALSSGRASIVTDRVTTFTERGVQLAAGGELEADVIITATGLRLQAMAGMSLSVDGAPVRLPDQLVYKGMMLSGVPNFAFTVGYTNASWTLKADLTAAYVCRLLSHMRRRAYVSCMPAHAGPEQAREPLLNLNSGYILRSLSELPAQGAERPWRMRQNYALDVMDFRLRGVEDGVMHFTRARGATAASPSSPAAEAQPALSG
jgi:cation diffusion facilitator CzcD-associated flavoprotein CzcO